MERNFKRIEMERNMAWNRILPARKATVAAMTIVMMLGACSQRPDTGQDVGQDVGQDAGLNTGQVVRWDAGRDSGMGASSLAEASDGSVERIEPPCWWVGMKTPLQLMVYGEDIGQCTEVRFEGLRGVKVAAIHPADSPNYLFVDLKIGRGTRPGTGRLVFTRKGAQTKRQDDPASQAGVTDQRDRKRGGERFSYPYTIGARPDDRGRQSFSSEDVIYLIVPDRFANGDPSNDETPDTEDFADPGQPNARHGGDIQGIIDHLDYLEDLGVTALWPTPLLEDNAPRVSYHGYACSDYYRIDPRFGDNDLYFRMVRKAHERGIKILMDVVTNHCGSSHPWMQDLPLRDWVHVHEPYTNTNHVMSAAFDPYASRSDREQMESGWFVPSMPDMNLDNPFVLKYFQQWAVWWVAASGLDGFRVDTWFYNEKGPMSRWARAVRDEFPWLNIVGEVWSLQPDQVAYWQEGHPNPDGFDAGLPTVMDFPMMDAIQRAVSPSEDEAYQSRTGDLRAVYDALSHDFALTDPEHILLFFSNHDTPRMADFCEGDPARMRLALTLLATLRGIPQLFYGEEWMLRTGSTRRDDGRVRMDLFAAADEAGPAGRAGSGGS
ncbi:MAG: cyclomaltodextrinase N-terminal domain-containing protein, partial [Bacteroidales bacterium]|nr:cyclomaltodextrinase N-terminal domain-containing protein [Bacteroidales bacterium]